MSNDESNLASRRRFLHCFILILITAIGGVIRFYHLAHPPLWYDESRVFWRICGSYGDLLTCLRTDGFVPLHYELAWLITRHWSATPLVLRFVPALCGTLMVPAIYFLGRQLLGRTTSLLAAALTACSAFLLFYSRDAKMYMDAWFFSALNIGCLLWWFRTNRSTAWLCWIASGCIACGLHISSAIPVGISALFLFTQNKMRWQQTLLWIAGIVLIVSGPVGHYEKFNTWLERTDESWSESGLNWIGMYNHDRTGPEHVRYLATSFVMGWEWPNDDDIKKMPIERFSRPKLCSEIILSILVVGCLPWPRRWVHGDASLTARSGSSGLSAEEAEHRGFRPRLLKSGDPQPQWRVALWLSLLIVLPVYGFYCRSIPDFSGPVDWWNWCKATVPAWSKEFWAIPLLVALLIVGQLAITFRDGKLLSTLLRGLGLLIVFATVLSLCWVMAKVCTAQSKAANDAGKPWESVWVPRYIGFVWPAVVIAIAALIMRLPTRPVRILAILFLLTTNLWLASLRLLDQTEPPVDIMARDYVDGSIASNNTLTVMNIYRGAQYPGGGNLIGGPGEYYISLLENLHTNPVDFNKATANLVIKHREFFPNLRAADIPANVDRIILWNQSRPQTALPDEDQLQRLTGWKLQSETVYTARDYWIRQDKCTYRRRVYVRSDQSLGLPSDRRATTP